MRGIAVTLFAATSAVLLTACGSSTGPPSGSASGGATQAATSAPASATASQSAVATSLDPCQLVTSSEASSLAGTSFGSGKEETSSGGGRQCVYGYQTANVFTVEVGQAQDTATAQADWSQAQAQAKALVKEKLPAGMHVSLNTSDVANLGDRASTVYGSTSISGQAVGLSGIYVLKGATFFAFQDLLLGHAPPSTAAMQSEAQTTLSRVP